MKHNLTNLPFEATKSDYEECVDLIVKEASENDSVCALYLLGSPWVPGVSDLDIVVVYKNTDSPLSSPWLLSENARRIVTHRYLSFSEEDFQKYFYTLYPIEVTDLRLLVGSDMHEYHPAKELLPRDYADLLVSAVADNLVNKLLLSPILGTQKEAVNVRQLLGFLHSITYTETLMQRALDPHYEGRADASVSALREKWFEHSFEENLTRLEKERLRAQKRVLDLVEQVDAYLKTKCIQPASFKNKQYSIIFTPEWNRQKFLDTYRMHTYSIPFRSRSLKHFAFKLPSSFLSTLLCNARYKGSWSTLVQKAVCNSQKEGCSRGLLARSEAINEVFEHTVETNGFYRAPFLYGFSLFEMRHPFVARQFTEVMHLLS